MIIIIIKSFLSFDDFRNIFNIKNSDFLKYYTLIKSIPLQWQTQLQNEKISEQHIFNRYDYETKNIQ